VGREKCGRFRLQLVGKRQTADTVYVLSTSRET
jgi:hypothetical protein